MKMLGVTTGFDCMIGGSDNLFELISFLGIPVNEIQTPIIFRTAHRAPFKKKWKR